MRYQRFAVKEDKLRRTMLGLQAQRAMKRWRIRHMKKTVYGVIEAKLIRLNQRQKKREILKTWMAKTFTQEKEHSSGVRSDHHKNYLVSYYSDLCSISPK